MIVEDAAQTLFMTRTCLEMWCVVIVHSIVPLLRLAIPQNVSKRGPDAPARPVETDESPPSRLTGMFSLGIFAVPERKP